jgi:hypothetical protein
MICCVSFSILAEPSRIAGAALQGFDIPAGERVLQ